MKYNKIGILIILISTCINLFSQVINVLTPEQQSEVDKYLEISKQYKLNDNIAKATEYLNKVAFKYWENNIPYKAIEYFNQSLTLYESTVNFLNETKIVYSNLGLIYLDIEDLENSYKSFEKSLQIRRKIGDPTEIAAGLLDLAYTSNLIKDYEKSNKLTEEALEIGLKLNDSRLILNCYRLMSKNYDLIGNIKKAEEFNNKYLSFLKFVDDQNRLMEFQKKEEKNLAEIEKEKAEKRENELRYELERRIFAGKQDSLAYALRLKAESLEKAEKEKLLREKELENLQLKQKQQESEQKILEAKQRTNQIIIYLGASILIVILTLMLILIRINRSRNRLNKELIIKGTELESAYKQIETQNINITKSINYAKGIQKALLPKQEILNTYLPESFIFFKPRDIVSGDFYFFSEIDKNIDIDEKEKGLKNQKIADPIESLEFLPIENHKFVIAAVDCTGHGVPGAFMSLIGYNLLEEIISRGISRADLILNELHRGVRRILRQDVTENRDGMDLALCIINRIDKTVSFAGAQNSLIYIQDGEIFHLKGDRYPIGGLQTEKSRCFTQQVIQVNKPTWFYIFSDGYIDQFGGHQGRKFLITNLRNLLYDIHRETFENQKKILEDNFNNWLGNTHKQIDDVLVIGFKLG